MKFKVRRSWWIWALWVFWHAFTIRFFQAEIYSIVVVTVILDIFLIFPEASHFGYDITYRQLTVKRLIYPNISFPCAEIAALEKPILHVLRDRQGAGPVRIKDNLGAYKIIYIIKKKNYEMMKSVVISAKQNKEFLNELALNSNAAIKIEISKLIEDININGDIIV